MYVHHINYVDTVRDVQMPLLPTGPIYDQYKCRQSIQGFYVTPLRLMIHRCRYCAKHSTGIILTARRYICPRNNFDGSHNLYARGSIQRRDSSCN